MNDPASGAPVARVRDLAFAYGGADRPALRGITLDVHAREELVIEGPSGGGKSTLLSVLTSEREPESGSVRRGRGVRIEKVFSEITIVVRELGQEAA